MNIKNGLRILWPIFLTVVSGSQFYVLRSLRDKFVTSYSIFHCIQHGVLRCLIVDWNLTSVWSQLLTSQQASRQFNKNLLTHSYAITYCSCRHNHVCWRQCRRLVTEVFVDALMSIMSQITPEKTYLLQVSVSTLSLYFLK